MGINKLSLKIILALFLLQTQVYSQSGNQLAKIESGVVQKESFSEIKQVLGRTNNGIVILKKVKRDLMLSICNDNLQETIKKDIDLPDIGFKRRIEFVLLSMDEVFVFSSISSRKEDRISLKLDRLSSSDFSQIGPTEDIMEMPFERPSKRGFFSYCTSRDKSKIMVFGLSPNDSEQGVHYSLKVFDTSMKLLWQKNDRVELPGKYIVLSQLVGLNSGDACLVVKEYPERKDFKSRKTSNYKYHIMLVDKLGNVKDIELVLKDKFITECQLEEGTSGNVRCIGFYSNRPEQAGKIQTLYSARKESSAGIFTMEVGENFNVMSTSMQDFSFELVVEDMSDRTARKAKEKEDAGEEAELVDYVIRTVHVLSDGSSFCIAEQYWIRIDNSGGNYQASPFSVGAFGGVNYTTGSSSTTRYYYNDIIVFKLDSKGNLQWNKRIPKRQSDRISYQTNTRSVFELDMMSANAGNSNLKPELNEKIESEAGQYCSFYSCVKSDELYVFYNDNPKNHEPGHDLEKRVFRTGRRGETVLVCNKFDLEGNFQKELIIEQAKKAVPRIMTKLSYLIDSSHVFLVGDMGKVFQYFKIELK